MGNAQDFDNRQIPAWCPGCGNFAILKALKEALAAAGLAPADILLVSGIGQAAKTPHYLRGNVFNGLHGRALPAATGAHLVNQKLKVIVESGDGCLYGEGGNHFLATLRRNPDLTIIAHNNQIYGLTKGQASPTSACGMVTKAQPRGVFSEAFNPILAAVTFKAGFVARGFSGNGLQLSRLITEALAHPGLALIDVLQPCVSFNKTNTFAWYKQRCYEIGPDHDPYDRTRALTLAEEWGEKIPLGVIYRNRRPPYESNFTLPAPGPAPAARRELLRGLLADFV